METINIILLGFSMVGALIIQTMHYKIKSLENNIANLNNKSQENEGDLFELRRRIIESEKKINDITRPRFN